MGDLSGLLGGVIGGGAAGWDQGRARKYAKEVAAAKHLQEVSLENLRSNNSLKERKYSQDRIDTRTDKQVSTWGAPVKRDDGKFYEQGYLGTGEATGKWREAADPNARENKRHANVLAEMEAKAKKVLPNTKLKEFSKSIEEVHKLEEERAKLFTVKALGSGQEAGLLADGTIGTSSQDNTEAIKEYDALIEKRYADINQRFPELSGANKRKEAELAKEEKRKAQEAEQRKAIADQIIKANISAENSPSDILKQLNAIKGDKKAKLSVLKEQNPEAYKKARIAAAANSPQGNKKRKKAKTSLGIADIKNTKREELLKERKILTEQAKHPSADRAAIASKLASIDKELNSL